MYGSRLFTCTGHDLGPSPSDRRSSLRFLRNHVHVHLFVTCHVDLYATSVFHINFANADINSANAVLMRFLLGALFLILCIMPSRSKRQRTRAARSAARQHRDAIDAVVALVAATTVAATVDDPVAVETAPLVHETRATRPAARQHQLIRILHAGSVPVWPHSYLLCASP